MDNNIATTMDNSAQPCPQLIQMIQSAEYWEVWEIRLILHTYRSIMELVLNSMLKPLMQTFCIGEAMREWDSKFLEKSEALPSIHEIWEEVHDLLSGHLDDDELFGPGSFKGHPCRKLDAHLYSALDQSGYGPMIGEILEEAPEFGHRAENILQQQLARLPPLNHKVPDLILCLTPEILSSEQSTRAILEPFASLSHQATRFIIQCEFQHDEDKFKAYVTFLEAWWLSKLNDALFPHPDAVRVVLASINLQGTFGILYLDAFHLAADTTQSRQTLAWRMHKAFVDAVLSVNTPKSTMLRGVVDAMWPDLTDTAGTPLPNYVATPRGGMATALGFPAYQQRDVAFEEDGSWEEFDPTELSGVHFEPEGEALDARDYSSPVHVGQEAPCLICMEEFAVGPLDLDQQPFAMACGHVFHYSCIERLINGTCEFSCLCPTCRYQICPPRPRRRISFDDDDHHGTNNSEVSRHIDAILAAEAEEVGSYVEESEDEDIDW